jgi:hypothetical protein
MIIYGNGFFSGPTHFEGKSEPVMNEGSALELPGLRPPAHAEAPPFFAMVRLWGPRVTHKKMGPEKMGTFTRYFHNCLQPVTQQNECKND